MAKPVLTDLDFGGVSKITNLPAPVAAGDAANKGYVDAAVEGLAWKDNVRVATQANISIASPGATVDGITMVANDRVLVRSQTAQTENGIYIWNGAAVPLTRALDADAWDELENATVSVDEGASAGTTYRQSAVNGTLGVTNIVWGSFGTAAPTASTTTAGIMRLATQADVDAGTVADEAVTPETLENWSGRIHRFAQTIGDGSATSIAVTHNLNSRDLHCQVFQASGTYDLVDCEVEMTTVNSVTFKFAAAPAASALRAVIIG